MNEIREILDAQARLDGETPLSGAPSATSSPELGGLRSLKAVLGAAPLDVEHPLSETVTLEDWRTRLLREEAWETDALALQARFDREESLATKQSAEEEDALVPSLERLSQVVRQGEPESAPSGTHDFYWHQIASAIEAEESVVETSRASHPIWSFLRAPWLASVFSALVTLGIGARMAAVAPSNAEGAMEVIYVAKADSAEMAAVYWIDDPEFTDFIED